MSARWRLKSVSPPNFFTENEKSNKKHGQKDSVTRKTKKEKRVRNQLTVTTANAYRNIYPLNLFIEILILILQSDLFSIHRKCPFCRTSLNLLEIREATCGQVFRVHIAGNYHHADSEFFLNYLLLRRLTVARSKML